MSESGPLVGGRVPDWRALGEWTAPTIDDTNRGPCLPAEFRKSGDRALNQQFWLWGQDIRRADGNLLLAWGFERERPPAGEHGSRSYAAHLAGGRSVVLWGFGLAFADPEFGVAYLSRFRLFPLLLDADAPPKGVWLPGQLPARREPASAAEWARARCLFVAALRWIGGYERWVANAVGDSARVETFGAWPRPACAAPALASFWYRLAAAAEASLLRATRR